MDVNEYQKSAMTTLNPTLDRKDVLINSVMGLCGESGEAIDLSLIHISLLGKGNAQVVRGSRFARTALLVCDSNSFHLVSSCKISSKLIQCFWYSCVTCTSVSL